jgi:hypothetical protein
MEVYVFYFYNIYLLVNYIFISVVPKIVKVVKHRVVCFVSACIFGCLVYFGQV